MNVRHPKLAEYPEIRRLFNVAYRADWGSDEKDEDVIADIEKRFTDIPGFLSNAYTAYSDRNELMAHVGVNPFKCFYHGNTVKMGGIGGVATYPEFRRSGAVKALMVKALQDMYANGYVLSYLYPFNHAFYRKYGYESHIAICRHSLSTYSLELRRTPPEGTWQMLKGETDPLWTSYKELYERYARQFNLMIVRNEERWQRFTKQNPYLGRNFSYYFTSDDGKVKAAFNYEVQGDGKDIFLIQDLAFSSPEGLEAILAFALRHRSDYQTVKLPLPENYPLVSLVKDVPNKELSHGMVRLVNVEQALGGLPTPSFEEKTEILISVSDELLTSNTGSYLLTIDDGETRILVEKLSEREVQEARNRIEATLTADIRELSLLCCGSSSFAELAVLPQLSYGGDARLLEALFPRRLNVINDYF